MKQKSEASEHLMEIIRLTQNRFNKTLKRFHSDGGKEFINDIFLKFLKQQGTELTYTPADTPQFNGEAESANKTIITKARSILNHVKGCLELWNYAIQFAVLIYNYTTKLHLDGEQYLIPGKIFNPQYEFNIQNIHIFGCNAYVLKEKNNLGKLDTQTKPGIYVGYNEQRGCHKILNSETLKLIESRDVQFDENNYSIMESIKNRIRDKAEQQATIKNKEYEVEFIQDEYTDPNDNSLHYLVKWKHYKKPMWIPQYNLTNCQQVIEEFLQQRKTIANNRRKYKSKAFFIEQTSESIYDLKSVNYPIPQCYRDILTHAHRKEWEKAIQNEINSLLQYNTFELVLAKDIDKKCIPTRWVFAIKRDSNNLIVRWKARLVAKGFKQQEGIDFYEIYAPAVKFKSIKLLLALAAHYDYEIKQIDFDTAFLNAKLKELIYIKIPEGFNQIGYDNRYVLRLNKALYGLKQAPREWWLELNSLLNKLNYNASPLDECLYVKWIDNKPIYLTLYVDDTLAIYPKDIEDTWLKDKKTISDKFKIKDLGDCEWILHMKIIRDRSNKILTLSQEGYLEQVLKIFGYINCKTISTPFLNDDITYELENQDTDLLDAENHTLYRSIVGSLLYAANITRIDLSYIIGILARYAHQPKEYQLTAARHVLRYLSGKPTLKLNL
ncbi:MAG: reverse transcriptase domain-containing protein [Nitrososphaeraceae archaeon]